MRFIRVSYKSIGKKEVSNMVVDNLEMSIVLKIGSTLMYKIVGSCE